jgi:uncharacterized RDD family membrane protein YckC
LQNQASESDNNTIKRGKYRRNKMTTESGIDFNHWILRLIALIIDSIIAAIPAYILYTVVLIALAFADPFFFVWGTWLLLPLLLGIFMLLYYVILDVYWGATIGKRLLGLQVQMVNGSKIAFDKAFIRNISKIFWLFLLLDWLIAVATPGADKRQKYTDRIAGTTVVSTKQPFTTSTSPPPPPPPPT